MNIFFLDSDPRQCAEWMVDKHVVKMILETAQLLSTAHRILDGRMVVDQSKTGRKVKRYVLDDNRETRIYVASHINHPSAVWARQSVENYNWLVDHLFALGEEYTARYGKRHKVFQYQDDWSIGSELQSPPHNLKDWDWTTPPSAMDKKYVISDDPIVNYRNYYKNGKTHLHSWKDRLPPEWIA